MAASGSGATGRAHPHSQPSGLSGADASRARAPDYARRPGRGGGGGKPVSCRPCRVAGRARVAGRLLAILVSGGGSGSGARIAGPRHPRGTARTHAPARNTAAATQRTHARTYSAAVFLSPPQPSTRTTRRSRTKTSSPVATQPSFRTHARSVRARVRSFVRFVLFIFILFLFLLKIFRSFFIRRFFCFCKFLLGILSPFTVRALSNRTHRYRVRAVNFHSALARARLCVCVCVCVRAHLFFSFFYSSFITPLKRIFVRPVCAPRHARQHSLR